jgi:ketosteroid isomerase-like protein
MSADANKELIRRYIQAIDENDSSDWSVLDDYLAEDFVMHNPRFRACRSTVTG